VITKKASVLEFLANLPNRSQLPPLASVKPGRVKLALLDVGPAGRHLEGSPLQLANQVADCRVNITGFSAVTVDPPSEPRHYGIAQVAPLERRLLGFR
jgi:hypothetical protein